MSLLLAATVLALLGLLAAGADLAPGMARIRELRSVEPWPAGGRELPTVSIVIAARNEERNIEEALRSVLALDYPGLEIIVVDDRSEDRTAEIVSRLAGRATAGPVLRVVRVDVLPAGWLGKCHALWHGVQQASGELLLFTDADVVMQPLTLRRAVRYLEEQRLDHLALGPEVRMPGTVLRAFTLTGTLFFCMGTRPWKARDAKSRAHIGIGAFNLIRRSAYNAMGGHRAIALRPDDDLKLGKLVKKHGLRQDFVIGRDMVSVEWYASTGELVRGLTKNAFAAVDYRWSAVIAGTAGQLLFFVWPPVATLVTTGAVRLTAGAATLVILLLHRTVTRTQRVPAGYALLFPMVSALSIFVLWRSTVITLLRGGIEWRGTHYPLSLLRTNRV